MHWNIYRGSATPIWLLVTVSPKTMYNCTWSLVSPCHWPLYQCMIAMLPTVMPLNSVPRHLYNVGPTSKTLGRRCINVIQMFCVYLVNPLTPLCYYVTDHYTPMWFLIIKSRTNMPVTHVPLWTMPLATMPLTTMPLTTVRPINYLLPLH